MDKKLASIYYNPRGYWRGESVVKKLVAATKAPSSSGIDVERMWLSKQAAWQIYRPAPRYIPRPQFDIRTPNEVHQADLLILILCKQAQMFILHLYYIILYYFSV